MYRYSQFIFKREINWLESHFYMILFLVKKCVCVCVCACAFVGLCVILTGKIFSKMTKFLQVWFGGGGI